MQYRILGSSDLLVSEIALGSWHTYGTGIDNARSIACVKRALDEGINLIDTANVYGRGAAESVIGEALQGVSRTSYLLATKLFFPMTETDYGLSKQQIHKQLGSSLKRLRTDYIDLYQCHRYDWKCPLEETMEALADVIQQGKVRYIGVSEWPVDRIRAALNMPGGERLVSSQPQYSMLWRQPETELFPFCRQHGVSNIVWSPLAQGALTGKYLPDEPLPETSRAAHPYMGKDFDRRFLKHEVLRAIQDLQSLAVREGMSLTQFALAWILRVPDVAAVIVGASSAAQITENAKASGRMVDPLALDAADRILESVVIGRA